MGSFAGVGRGRTAYSLVKVGGTVVVVVEGYSGHNWKYAEIGYK